MRPVLRGFGDWLVGFAMLCAIPALFIGIGLVTELTRGGSSEPPPAAKASTYQADDTSSDYQAADSTSANEEDGDGCNDNYDSYSCVPADDYDLNCSDIEATDVEVLDYDEYGLDADGDGYGCESDTGYDSYDSYDSESYDSYDYDTGGADLDCSDMAGPVYVGPDDPNGLDGDGDGMGCES